VHTKGRKDRIIHMGETWKVEKCMQIFEWKRRKDDMADNIQWQTCICNTRSLEYSIACELNLKDTEVKLKKPYVLSLKRGWVLKILF
jgi:hypothetical protein